MRSRGELLTHIYSQTGGIVASVVLKKLMKRLRRDRRQLEQRHSQARKGQFDGAKVLSGVFSEKASKGPFYLPPAATR